MSKELLDEYAAAWPKHTKVTEDGAGQKNLQDFLALLSDDAEYEDVPTGHSFKGHEGIAQLCAFVSAQYDVTVAVTSAQTDGERFALEFESVMKIKESGDEVTSRGVAVGTITDGKISSHRDYSTVGPPRRNSTAGSLG